MSKHGPGFPLKALASVPTLCGQFFSGLASLQDPYQRRYQLGVSHTCSQKRTLSQTALLLQGPPSCQTQGHLVSWGKWAKLLREWESPREKEAPHFVRLTLTVACDAPPQTTGTPWSRWLCWHLWESSLSWDWQLGPWHWGSGK